MDRIIQARNAISNADYVLIGAGAGLSTAAGLEYSVPRYENNFGDFIEKYGLTDMYSATFYPLKHQKRSGLTYLATHIKIDMILNKMMFLSVYMNL